MMSEAPEVLTEVEDGVLIVTMTGPMPRMR